MTLRNFSYYLDAHFPFERHLGQRLILQCVLTTLVGVGTIVGFTELVNAMATDKPIPESFYTHDIFLFFIWILVVDGIYIGAYFYYQFRHAERNRQQATTLRQQGFVVRSGKQSVVVPFEQIVGFCVEDEYTVLMAQQSKRYVLDQSLDKLEKTLPIEWFFRLNRQYLLHRQIIIGFVRHENGKLRVNLKTDAGLPAQLSVSRTKAVTFKTWFMPAERIDASPGISLHFAENKAL
ncbi:LytR/AlgR family response regulator transcription factor [Spirosoma spitsbergense]|uniref:LytR/AlgR family response regulator transcription factor n=1 Tax=Spirosoma spitsbergense TaxID=431554 RepID=UPI0003828960|nr:LytTR family DNA-binding domain-containing protein [Spirosoma spitsbergense]